MLRIEPFADTDHHRLATSFLRVPGLADASAVSLRLFTDSSVYLAHDNGRLVVARPGGGRAERARATFRVS